MRTPHKNLCLALALSTALLSGCASIVGDSSYPIAVSSTPGGASFEVKDSTGKVVHSGITPSTVTLKSGEGYFDGAEYTIAFKKDGYADQEVKLDSSLSGWYWGNILFGGLIGMLIVDPLTGAMYKLPEEANAQMGAQLVGGDAGKDLTLLTIDQLPEAQRDQLIRIN
ncbi:hypothetical protein [Pseudomonas sp. Q1-7]|uniref:hypothetical protein n=1 Tax=Pseudomonas sp. Q1-7 TaxID=3020843 RepID=UPI003FA7B00B